NQTPASGSPAAAPSVMTLDWSAPSKAPTGWKANTPRALPRVLPDFGVAPTGGTLGSGGSGRFRSSQMATVIVRSEDGWGSGAFISADGWLLTNYHVVERAAQRASISGAVATLDVIAPEVAGDRLKAGQARRARLYRADPVHDLALLKLESPPAPLAFFKLADKVDEGQDCIVIGSQGNGPAWWVRASIVSQVFDFPADLSQVAAGVVSDRPSLDRNTLTVLLTDARVSSGDSGGPLVNDAGELIGLTFATPRNATSGSVGWHVALPHLKAFVANLPAAPEGVPFDAWTAGLGEDIGFDARFVDGNRDGRIDAVQVEYGTSEDGQPRLLARTTFVDFAQRATETQASNRRLPSGLWGVDGRGTYQFDVFLTARADGLAAAGYANREGIVDEIRVGRLGEENAGVVWRRTAAGRWQATRPSTPELLIDEARLGAENVARLQAIASDQVRSGPAGRGANKQGGR
ncbi:MAG TPA: serine protease, partial [Vicinamibacterales bacterium]|nr:serine protease [Vicinamibacterales bacterium]